RAMRPPRGPSPEAWHGPDPSDCTESPSPSRGKKIWPWRNSIRPPGPPRRPAVCSGAGSLRLREGRLSPASAPGSWSGIGTGGRVPIPRQILAGPRFHRGSRRRRLEPCGTAPAQADDGEKAGEPASSVILVVESSWGTVEPSGTFESVVSPQELGLSDPQ